MEEGKGPNAIMCSCGKHEKEYIVRVMGIEKSGCVLCTDAAVKNAVQTGLEYKLYLIMPNGKVDNDNNNDK